MVDGKIYVIGGDMGGNYNRVDIYDPSSNKWSRGATMPTKRNDLSCSVLDGKIYAFGGDFKEISSDVVEKYDPTTDTWETKHPMGNTRMGLSTCLVDGRIYAIGGMVWPGGATVSIVEVYY